MSEEVVHYRRVIMGEKPERVDAWCGLVVRFEATVENKEQMKHGQRLCMRCHRKMLGLPIHRRCPRGGLPRGRRP